MMEGWSFRQYINVLNQIISNLKRVDLKFKDGDKALISLNYLLTSATRENFITTLMWEKVTMDLEEIIDVLLGFRYRKKSNDESSQI